MSVCLYPVYTDYLIAMKLSQVVNIPAVVLEI